MKKNKPVIVEHRYVGLLPFPSWKEWHKFRAYRDVETAQMAVDNLSRKHNNFEFRVRLPTLRATDAAQAAVESDGN